MKFEEIDWEQIQKDHDVGLTMKDIKKKYHIGSTSIQKAKETGVINFKRKPLSAEQKTHLSQKMKKLGIKPPAAPRKEKAPTKKCTRCHKEKPLSEYHKKSASYDGRHTACRECRNKINRAYVAAEPVKQRLKDTKKLVIKQAREFLNEYLSKKCCEKCGENDHRLLQFHHLNGKEFNVNRMVNHSIENIKKEISKCQILCNNCHSPKRKSPKHIKHKSWAWYRKIKYDLINQIHGDRCLRCGGKSGLELNHVDPSSKKFNVGDWSNDNIYDLSELESEIQKCELLCSNCHKLNTANKLDNYYKDNKYIIKEFNNHVVLSIDQELRCDPKKFKNKFIIFEDEWKNKYQLFSNIISRRETTSMRPQKCEISLVSHAEVKDFYDTWHYIGACGATYHIAVRYGEEILAAMSIGKPTRRQNSGWELMRMASNLDYSIHGIWSYLFKWISRNKILNGSLFTFSDNRLFDGGVYKILGFEFTHNVPPSYYWVKNGIRYSKSSMRKTKEEQKSRLSETQLRVAQGYHKIWDAGKKKWSIYV